MQEETPKRPIVALPISDQLIEAMVQRGLLKP
jgi:hypothetical protein